MKRVATALVLIPVIVWVVLWSSQWVFQGVLVLVGMLALREFDQISAAQGLGRAGLPGMAAGLTLLFAPEPAITVVLIAVAAMTLALRVSDLKQALPYAATFILGVVYIFGAWRCAIGLRGVDPHWLMLTLLVSWAGDTAALYVGRSMGRHKLAPRISPGKTWEGSVGSITAGLLAAAVYAHYLIPSARWWLVLALAAAANVAGQAGDLCESAFKRGAGVKDSGTTLPGHGGWLDRIDSTLFAVPVVYAVQRYLC